MRSFIMASALLLAIGAPAAAIDDKIADRLWESSKVLDELVKAPDAGIPKDLLKRAMRRRHSWTQESGIRFWWAAWTWSRVVQEGSGEGAIWTARDDFDNGR